MKERPILFSAPMVRALLAGTKTQTRRVVKWRDVAAGLNLSFSGLGVEQTPAGWVLTSPSRSSVEWRCGPTACPYGQPGERLWVRETWQGPIMSADEWEQHGNDDPGSLPSRFNSPSYCEYAADGGPPPEFMTADDDLVCRWRPSIHMPRWASRITLEVTGVRVERLQDISDADCFAEGIQQCSDEGLVSDGTARGTYKALWESINGPGSWDANPWVWVVEVRRADPSPAGT